MTDVHCPTCGAGAETIHACNCNPAKTSQGEPERSDGGNLPPEANYTVPTPPREEDTLLEGGSSGSDLSRASSSPEQHSAGRWRPEVEAFADLMEATLRANDHKGGWKDCSPHWLHKRLLEEAAELEDAQTWKSDDGPMRGGYARAIGREAADVANFAMMIADVCGALQPKTEG